MARSLPYFAPDYESAFVYEELESESEGIDNRPSAA
jgi:hypothetical protein